MKTPIGKQIVDIAPLLDVFEAQEGEVQHIIGKTGQGKTYEGTRRAAGYLYSGYTVYTTWKMYLPDYYDEREHIWPVLRNFLLRRKEFFRFDLKHNWKYVDIQKDFSDGEGVIDTEKLARFLAKITDAIFFLDEGQDVFDSHQRAGKIARQTITRTRHMHKTLIILSQRAQAVDVTARGNVTYFYKCEKRWFFGTRFKVYRTDEIDESSNYPIWVRHDSTGRVVWKAPLYHSGYAKQWVYDMYDSWYMRQEMIRSQDIKVDAYAVGFFQRFRLLARVLFGRDKPKKARAELSTPPQKKLEKQPERSTIKGDEVPIIARPVVHLPNEGSKRTEHVGTFRKKSQRMGHIPSSPQVGGTWGVLDLTKAVKPYVKKETENNGAIRLVHNPRKKHSGGKEKLQIGAVEPVPVAAAT